jgi:hypothetical protein
LLGRVRSAEGQTRGKGKAFPYKGTAEPQGEETLQTDPLLLLFSASMWVMKLLATLLAAGSLLYGQVKTEKMNYKGWPNS